MKLYSRFLDRLELFEKISLAIVVAVMIIVMIYQVILRYVFSASNAWSEELARYLFIYSVMIAGAMATRKGSHLQVDVLINLLKPKAKALFTMCATFVGVVFLCFLFKYSITLCQSAVNNISAGLKISMAIPYACIPIGTVLMILTSIEVILKQVPIVKGMEEGKVDG